MTNFINLTPHAVVFRGPAGDQTFPPSGKVARVSELPCSVTRTIEGIPILSRTQFGEVLDLPEPSDGTVFIVSGLVAGQVSRADVIAPATGPNDGAVRNEKGHIVAVTQFKGTI